MYGYYGETVSGVVVYNAVPVPQAASYIAQNPGCMFPNLGYSTPMAYMYGINPNMTATQAVIYAQACAANMQSSYYNAACYMPK